mmetsp:Transcript_1773/g.2707  ORF Transcript_1773/g.2707 Transcript_1773/m.2707 type:complete len:228 (-) Transcript_1773:920-1603(-)
MIAAALCLVVRNMFVMAISIRPLRVTDVENFCSFRAALFAEGERLLVSRRDDLIRHVSHRLDEGAHFLVATTNEDIPPLPKSSPSWDFSFQPSLDVREMLCQKLDDGQTLVGMLECSTAEFKLPTHSLDINNVYLVALGIHPLCRRQGIASQLLDAANEYAKQKEARALWLHVENDNQNAIHFYQAANFTRQDSSRPDSHGRQLAVSLGINPDLHISFCRDVATATV